MTPRSSDGAGAPRHAFVACFGTAAGARVLAHLRRMTIERRLGPDAPAALLRHVEGQRALVALIERLAEPEAMTGETDR